MAKLKCKGEDIKPFVKALAVLGKGVSDLRLESNGTIFVGSAVPENHNALVIAKMDLDGLASEDMQDLTVAVGMYEFKGLVDLAAPEDDVELVMDLGRLNLRTGKHIQRSYPLIGEVPGPLDPKVVPPFSWKMAVESIKPMVKALDLDDKYAQFHVKKMEAGLMFSTEAYGGAGAAKASYTIAAADLIEAGPMDLTFDVRYPFDQVSALKDLPAEGMLTFRSGQDMPLEVLATSGRLSLRAMFAPMIRND